MDTETRAPAHVSYSNIAATGQARQHIGDHYGSVYNISNTFALHCRRTLAVGGSEGIRLATCVSGLKNLINNVVTRVHSQTPTKTQPSQSFPLPQEFVDGLVESQAVLTQLELQLRNISSIPYERTSLIQADHLFVSFTNGVLLFSDIQRYLQSLDGPHLGTAETAHDKLEPTSLVQSLNNQNAIWRSQLDLLRCTSQDEAHGEALVLEALTSKLLAENNDLKRRMDSIEREVAELAQNDSSSREELRHSFEDIHTLEKAGRVSLDLWQFEEILEQSWVYKRNGHREEMMSFNSSLGRDDAWSEISKLTLAHLSIISVIALPVKISELTDSSWYQSNWHQNKINIAAQVLRARTSGKAPIREKLPISSPASKNMRTVSLLAAELLKADDEARGIIGIIDKIALEIRTRGDEQMQRSLDSAGSGLSKALIELKQNSQRGLRLPFETPSLLQTELNIAFALLSACERESTLISTRLLGDELDVAFSMLSHYGRPSDSLPKSQPNRTSKSRSLPVKGVLRNLTQTIVGGSSDASRIENPRRLTSLNLLSRKQSHKTLDDLVFSCEGYSTLELSCQNLSELPHRDLQAMTKELHIIVLDDNRISDLKDAQATLKHVKVLQIRRNGLMHFPANLLQLKLSSLDISHNYIDRIPPQVSEMPELQELAVQGNSLTRLPAAVWRMDRLERLYVQWTVWRAWCEENEENVDWRIVERFDVGLYAEGWVELERDRFPLYEE